MRISGPRVHKRSVGLVLNSGFLECRTRLLAPNLSKSFSWPSNCREAGTKNPKPNPAEGTNAPAEPQLLLHCGSYGILVE